MYKPEPDGVYLGHISLDIHNLIKLNQFNLQSYSETETQSLLNDSLHSHCKTATTAISLNWFAAGPITLVSYLVFFITQIKLSSKKLNT